MNMDVSVGSFLAIAIGLLRMSAVDCLDFYISLAKDVFSQPRNINSHGSTYDETRLEQILISKLPMKKAFKDYPPHGVEGLNSYVPLSVSSSTGSNDANSKKERIPHVVIISKRVDTVPTRSFVFSNSPSLFRAKGVAPGAGDILCDGTDTSKLWEAVRASSAMPMHFRPFRDLEGRIHIDGSFAINGNPTSFALQQLSKLYSPSAIKHLVSVGTGIYVLPGDKRINAPRTIVDNPKYAESLHEIAVGSAALSNGTLPPSDDANYQNSQSVLLRSSSLSGNEKRRSFSKSTKALPSPKAAIDTSKSGGSFKRETSDETTPKATSSGGDAATGSSSTTKTGTFFKNFRASVTTKGKQSDGKSPTHEDATSKTTSAASKDKRAMSSDDKTSYATASGSQSLPPIPGEASDNVLVSFLASNKLQQANYALELVTGVTELLGAVSQEDAEQVHINVEMIISLIQATGNDIIYSRLNPPLRHSSEFDEKDEEKLNNISKEISTFLREHDKGSKLLTDVTHQLMNT